MKRILGSLLLLSTASWLPAQAPDAPSPPPGPESPSTRPTLTPEQIASVTKQLDALEQQITKGRGDLFGMALSKVKAGAASEAAALSLYLDCYKVEHFDKRNLKTTDFQAWKDNSEARLKDEEFQKGLVLQLEYLLLTIQAQNIEEPKDMAPLVAALQGYIPRAIAAVQATMKHTASGAIEEKDSRGGGRGPGGRGPGGGGRGPGGGGGPNLAGQLAGILRQSVRGTEFSRALQIDDYMRRREWEYSPLEIEGIYNQVILPYYLSEKPSEVPAQLDAQINSQMALSKVAMSEAEYTEFYKEQYPRMLWSKANFMFQKNINSINAMADMLKVIRDNPSHPNAAEWLKQLRFLVNDNQPDVKSPGATPEPAPPAPGT